MHTYTFVTGLQPFMLRLSSAQTFTNLLGDVLLSMSFGFLQVINYCSWTYLSK